MGAGAVSSSRTFWTRRFRVMFNTHVKLRGTEPSQDTEPTLDQVCAIHQVIAAGFVPFADFSLFGLLGKRLSRKLSFSIALSCPMAPWTTIP